MKKLFTIVLMATATAGLAQTERTAFTQSGKGVSVPFATDYQCAGINPSNLGWKSKHPAKKVTFGLLELGYSLTSTAFDGAGLRDDFIGSLTSDPEDFDYREKVDGSKMFTGNSLAFNVDAMAFGIAFQDSSIGGISFVVRDRMQWFTEFNKNVSEIMFQGYLASYFTQLVLDSLNGQVIANDANVTDDQRARVVRGGNPNGMKASKLLNGSAYEFLWYREYGLNYGRQVVKGEKMDLFAGVGIKYLQGFGLLDISSDGSEFIARSAMSPGFKIDYGDDHPQNPTYVAGDKMKPVGRGIGVDIGISAIINENMRIGFSICDLGSITWDGNVYVAADSVVSSLDEDGFDNYNFFDQADNFAADKGIYDWLPSEAIKVKLPTTLRGGAGYIVNEKVEVGVEAVVPMNEEPGALRGVVFGLGGEYKPVEWIGLNLGLSTGGIYPMRIPFGLMIMPPSGTWEGGFAFRDVLSLGGGDEPTLGMCFGILRFRI